MRSFIRLSGALFYMVVFMGAVGLDSGGGSARSEHFVLQGGSLGGSFAGQLSVAGPYKLTSAMPVVSVVVGDFNADGDVNFGDFLLFAQNFGRRVGQSVFDVRFDLNADGEVGFADFLIFASAFGQ